MWGSRGRHFGRCSALWAALFGVVVLRERLQMKTAFALAFSLVSVLLVFMPRLLPQPRESQSTTTGYYSLAGELLVAMSNEKEAGSR